jgi:hypothetical protein
MAQIETIAPRRWIDEFVVPALLVGGALTLAWIAFVVVWLALWAWSLL